MKEVDSRNRFECLSNLNRRGGMVSLDKEVDVIGHHFDGLKYPIVNAARFGNDAF